MCDVTAAGVSAAYDCIGLAVSAYERSREVSPFSSKYDAYLAGEAKLTKLEEAGRELYEGKGKCALCHPSQPGPNGEPPLFTDFTFDNLGVPKNLLNPFYWMPPEFNPDGTDFIDEGLGGFLKSAGKDAGVYELELGKQKVPTLRNVDKRPVQRLREGLRSQRRVQVAEVDRPLLQHAGRAG